MAIDVLPETQSRAEPGHREQTPPDPAVHQSAWLRRVLLAVGLTAVAAAAVAALIPGILSSGERGPRLTHTIARGELIVTITEQGTVESSDNTEIKCKVRGHNTVTWVIPSGSVVKAGDELVRLDVKRIEETVSQQRTKLYEATATLAETAADMAGAQINLDAYLEGRFRSRLKRTQTDLTIAEANLASSRKMLKQSELLFNRGYITALELEGNGLTVTQAELQMKVKQTELDVLERYTKQMNLEGMRGNLTYQKGKLKADQAGLRMTESRLNRALAELKQCVVTAERDGLVIYPTAAAWKDTPDITEGATVAKEQVLLIMPDLTKMQIKVGVHESIVDRVRAGLPAHVTLTGRSLDAEVTSVATITRPAGWWTGNIVKYDTLIELPRQRGLKPGMSAEVVIILSRHSDVLTIPVAAVVETEAGNFCWVQGVDGPQRRPLQLGPSNQAFMIVEAGLKEGDQVLLNPAAFIEEGQEEATTGQQSREDDSEHENDSGETQSFKVPGSDK